MGDPQNLVKVRKRMSRCQQFKHIIFLIALTTFSIFAFWNLRDLAISNQATSTDTIFHEHGVSTTDVSSHGAQIRSKLAFNSNLGPLTTYTRYIEFTIFASIYITI